MNIFERITKLKCMYFNIQFNRNIDEKTREKDLKMIQDLIENWYKKIGIPVKLVKGGEGEAGS